MDPLGPVVGIVGAGQLARMTVQAAIALAVPVRLLAARPDDGAALVWPAAQVGSPDSLDALRDFAARCDVLTFDHELVDPAHLAALEAEGRCLRPSAAAQRFAQDKGYQRERFQALGLPVPPHRRVHDLADLTGFAEEHGWPAVAKARRGGYDGRGVWVLDGPLAARELVDRCDAAGIPLIAERYLPIERELAVPVARRPGGATALYPLVQTGPGEGICHEGIAPAPVGGPVAAEAERLGVAVAEAAGVHGILAGGLFLAERRLWVNEVATRPHNSGHFSIEGAATSQFENHLRAVLDWPLGATTPTAPVAVMANVLGNPAGTDLAVTLPIALSVPGVRIHLYGKEPRPGRKIGHVTALGSEIEETRSRALRAATILAGREPA